MEGKEMPSSLARSIVSHYEAGSNCQVFNGNISGCVFAMPGATVTQQSLPPPSKPPVAEGETMYEVQTLVECVGAVRHLFWGDSSMAVIFGVCRDCFHYADNMSQFERDFGCSEGLISNTMRHNPYMRLAVDKWEHQGAKKRVLRLVEEYQKAVSARQKRLILTE